MTQTFSKDFLTWDEAYQAETRQVGGKGWNLGRLARFGFRIPVGGVLSTDAYLQFMAHNQLEGTVESVSQIVNNENLDKCEDRLTRLREQIQAGSLPPRVEEELKNGLGRLGLSDKPIAVRSSASAEDSAKASFAGMHESYLNVSGWENISEAIKGCFASLWSPPAVAYRRKLNIPDQEVLPAVVLMEMVDAQSAGVAFTCDPQTGRQDLMVINANFGLGESVVSGAIEPDTYYLDNSAYCTLPRLITKKIGSKQGMTQARASGGTHYVTTGDLALMQPLSDENIVRLGLILLRVFEALGDCEQHQDVEWAFDGQDFILLQARPVTSLPSYTFECLKSKPEIWSNGNYRDAVPMVLSPLHRRVLKTGIDTIQYTSLVESGYAMPEGFQFSRFFQGRLYCNISALQWAYYDSSGMLPRDFNPFWGGHQPEIEIEDQDPFQGELGLARQQRGMKGAAQIMKAAANASSTFAEVIFSAQGVIGKGINNVSDGDLVEKYSDLGQIIKAYCEKFSFLSGVGTLSFMALLQNLIGYLGPRTMIVLNGLMVGGEAAITSADHGYHLMELAELVRQDDAAGQYLTGSNFDPLGWEEQLPEHSVFKQAFRQFIRDYGHRGVYELDIINPRWKEDPSYLLDIIRSTIDSADLAKWKAAQKEKFEKAWQEVLEKVPLENHDAIRQGIKVAQEGAAVREMTKSVLVMAIEPYRLMAQEIGSRLCRREILAESTDVFFCSWSDLLSILSGEWNGKGLKNLVAARKIVQKNKEMLSPPDVILGEEPVFAKSKSIAQLSGDYLQGAAASAGNATGRARLISHPSEGTRLEPGEILIAPSTDPGWTPLFLKASAIIMETGGFLSHGAIVAREYGIPAVVNVPGVMEVIKEGQQLLVDGDEGKIFLL